ncbi:uncharacterized protein LOC111347516 [Stylophora pistillata]|uniref:uncharacterized protein LOC111347516 n=1 Tax=Stylophora pistillata TaxID=50429 RepID=UPI000C03A666|nr:uncharacterized protein LOC111347516 [Stylophora pistillata]
MRRANSAIERERYPIPTIEEILYDLNGSTVFSKLDIKWDFHQVELGERSREIPTFVTHLGLYRLNQCEPKDSSGEEFDFVKAVAEESLPVALTAKQVKRASDSDPELASLRQHILSGDWSQCKKTAYVCVKDELCVLGKLALRCTISVVPKALRGDV